MSKYFRPALFALAFVLIWSFLKPGGSTKNVDDIVLITDNKVSIGKNIEIEIQNNTEKTISLPSNCPNNPLKVEKYANGSWLVMNAKTDRENCKSETISVAPEESYLVGYTPWNAELFAEETRYRISLTTNINDEEKTFTKEIEVTSRSIFGTIWQEAFYKPIFNTLIYFIGIVPRNSLGLAIILLTIIIKLILLAPNQKALKAQRQMQKVQPQLDALKKKYKEDPKKLTEETMKIWKKYKVSPMGSCLPMLIQFPILIALFYVVKNGLSVINPQLLYAGLANFDASIINSNFLGIIDLTKANIIALPIIVGGLQFIQMKLSLGKNLSKGGAQASGPMMNKMMIYLMPIMIAVFTTTLPAAVGFYWGTSTLFGIGQQMVVNRSKD